MIQQCYNEVRLLSYCIRISEVYLTVCLNRYQAGGQGGQGGDRLWGDVYHVNMIPVC